MSIFDFVLQQYSSCLAQYKKQTFGGFYRDEVMAEIKRGTQLVGIHYDLSIIKYGCQFAPL